ncbi:MAG: hypothetical protein LBK01_06865 [Burkholderiaceae bacterium]|jgi:hypothetical protein|nr:hypothetical protein [Burkholderiaceae bacterium]
MKVPVYSIYVRRDPHTYTPVAVAAYETPILSELFGEENVHNAAGKRVDVAGLGNVVSHRTVDVDAEHERLAARYGAGESGTSLVEAVYGKKAAGGLKKAIEAAQKADVAKPKTKGESNAAAASV